MSLRENPLIRWDRLQRREYQERIAEEAIKRNTLVVLPTALGKTIIAVLAASYYIYNYSDKRVLFLAPTKPLVHQHQQTILRALKLRPEDACVITGEQEPELRLHLWDKSGARVFLATPESVRNDIENGLSLRDFSLIVFDEAHRARKDYAYTKVARAYLEHSTHPMILGLTASPGADRLRIQQVCDALSIESIIARTEEDPDVKRYVNPIKMEWRTVKVPDSYQPIVQQLQETLRRRLSTLSAMGAIRKDPEYIFRRDLLEAADEIEFQIETTMLEEEKRGLYALLGTISTSLILYHALELLQSQGPHTFKSFLEKLKKGEKASHRTLSSEPEFMEMLRMVDSLQEHPKLPLLRQIVGGELALNPGRVLVFTQYRDTAHYLAENLRGIGLKAERFIGHGARDSQTITQEDQLEILGRFREGKLNTLVSTSIGEEGLDIPQVDLVVFYEPVPSEIRLIQRRGRTGRARFGRVVILATEETLDMTYLTASKRKAEKMMNIVKSLNMELTPIQRGQPPPQLLMPMEVVLEAEKYTFQPPPPTPTPALVQADLIEPKPVEPTQQAMLDEVEVKGVEEAAEELTQSYNRTVNLAARNILRRALKMGGRGVTINLLLEDLEYEGISPGVVKAAVKRLTAARQLTLEGNLLRPYAYQFLKELKMRKVSYEAKFHTIEVEKVLPGRAIVLVDDKWHAILEAAEYNGPRSLIKRGSCFKAIASPHTIQGKFHVRIHGVAEAS